MSFYIASEPLSRPPQPQKAKVGVVSIAYNAVSNNAISYLDMISSSTIWVTGLAAAGTDTLSLPSDANMILLFDSSQVLVGCSKQFNLYVDAACTLDMTSPSSIDIPVAGMYDLEITVISSTVVYVSCQQISGGPEATSGQYVAPLTRSIPALTDIDASDLIPPAGSGELILVLAGAATLPTAPLLYVALYGTQTFSAGMGITFKVIGGGGDLSGDALNLTAGAVSPLPTPLVANSVYQVVISFTSATTGIFAGRLIGSNA